MALLKNKTPLVTDPTYYDKVMMAESGGKSIKNPQKGASATGIFQFTANTWKGMVDKMGLNYTLEDRYDPNKQKVVMKRFTEDNSKYLSSKLGITPNNTDLYMAHFLGAGGASNFLQDYLDTPDQRVNMPDNVIKYNKNVFVKKDGNLRTYKEVYNEMQRRLDKTKGKITPEITNYAETEKRGTFVPIPETSIDQSKLYSVDITKADKEKTEVSEQEQQVEAELDNAKKEEDFLNEYFAQQEVAQFEQPTQQMQESPAPNIVQDFTQIEQFVDTNLMQQGGIPTDPLGMWRQGNNPVIVPSNKITMSPNPITGEAFTKPIIGISDTGDKKILFPGKEYTFSGSKVLEIPIK